MQISMEWLANGTDPTSTVVCLALELVNASGGTYVAYLFAHNEQQFGEDSDEAITLMAHFAELN